ncbi:mechanosensitive ion channel protein MscS [Nocardioides szechwanensis]|uniref:Small conductance mechanosensitive channel n=2 Tax=Nocardioides szechwanensis TaxID=1005944 RepID=A0A1H0LEZ7_9ACTN|nr:mechanosensitive ion channel protein MscS [Nocardioides szechwanensis]SDO66749.1 small conductance mechanosensitive channel [Nocardioides szechwanensis]
MHERMFALETTDPCAAGEQICDAAFGLTGSTTAADIADVLIGTPLAIIGLLLLGLVLRWVLHRLVDRVVRRAEAGVLPDKVGRFSMVRRGASHAAASDPVTSTRRVQRAKTIGSLLKSIITGVLVAMFGTMILSELGVNIAPIIASAGILGLALGFGAQSLVKDFLSGIFMILEDQYGVGDVIDIGEADGTVEAVSLRVTRLRDVNGTVWYVPNGEIVRVGNMSQNWARTVLDISVGYGEDLARVRRVLQEVAHDLWEDEDYKQLVIEEPEVWGVEQLGPEGVLVRVTLKTAPLEQWAVAREMRQRIKARFDHEGIEIPLPQRVIWNRAEPAAPADDAVEGDRQ